MGAGGYLVVLSEFGGTIEYWVVLEVLGSNREVLWSTFEYGWVLLGVGGYWVGEY